MGLAKFADWIMLSHHKRIYFDKFKAMYICCQLIFACHEQSNSPED